MEETKSRNSLLIVTFIDLVGFGILLPILPFAALQVHATPMQIGVLAAAFSLFQILAMPLWGYAADKWGAKPVLLISLIGNALSYFLFAISVNYAGLLISRTLAGATSATLGVARGSLTVPGNPAATEKNMRLFGAAQGLGFLFGPVLGAVAQGFSVKSPVWMALTAVLLAIPFVLLQKKFPKPAQRENFSMVEKIRRLKSNPKLLDLNWVYGLLYFSFSLLFISFPLFLEAAYGFESHASAVYFSILSVSAVMGQLVLLPWLSKKWTKPTILKIAMLSLAILVVLLGTPWDPITTGVILSLTSIQLFTALPLLMAEIGLCSSQSEKNLAAGLSESMAGMARLLGTSLSGVIIQVAGLFSVFVFSASASALALGLFYLLNKRHQRQSQ